MPMVLEAFHFGDLPLYQTFPQLNEAPVIVHFQAKQEKINRSVAYGQIGEYRLQNKINSSSKGWVPPKPVAGPA